MCVMRLIDADRLKEEAEDELKTYDCMIPPMVAIRVAHEAIDRQPTVSKKAFAKITIDGEALQRCVDEAVENVKHELFGNSEQLEIIHCEDCIYYDPPHVDNDGMRLEYADLPKESLVAGLATCEYGVNIGGRCTRDYNAGYEDDKRVYVPHDNFCGRAIKREDPKGQK